MIPELLEKERDQSYQIAKKTGCLDDWLKAKRITNLCNKEIKNAKDLYILEKLKNHEQDASKFWETLNSVYPSNKSNSNNEIIINVDGNPIPLEDIADYMKQHLCTVGAYLANNIPHTHKLSMHKT